MPPANLADPLDGNAPAPAADWTTDALAPIRIIPVKPSGSSQPATHPADEPALSSTEADICAADLPQTPHLATAPSAATQFELRLYRHRIGTVNSLVKATQFAQQLQQLIKADRLDPEAIVPRFTGPRPVLQLAPDVVWEIDATMLQSPTMSLQSAAITLANNLRQALGSSPLAADALQLALQGLQASGVRLKGVASWYGPYFHGRLTATGETFDQHDLTAAHRTLPFGTLLQVRNLQNNRTVIVRINDRGPYFGNRSLDLSRAAARCLGGEAAGLINYEALVLRKATPSPLLVGWLP
jgi:hypothetical protein